jgi:hypothetical protein
MAGSVLKQRNEMNRRRCRGARVAVAGCIGDIGATTSEKADGNGQLRWYGGPKSPVWSGQ